MTEVELNKHYKSIMQQENTIVVQRTVKTTTTAAAAVNAPLASCLNSPSCPMPTLCHPDILAMNWEGTKPFDIVIIGTDNGATLMQVVLELKCCQKCNVNWSPATKLSTVEQVASLAQSGPDSNLLTSVIDHTITNWYYCESTMGLRRFIPMCQ